MADAKPAQKAVTTKPKTTAPKAVSPKDSHQTVLPNGTILINYPAKV